MTPPRASRWSGPAFALMLLAVWAQIALTLLEESSLNDLGSFIEAARAVERGDDPYRVYPLSISRAGIASPNLNPPPSLVLLRPLARIDPWTAFVGLAALSLALHVMVVAWIATRESSRATLARVLWAFALAGLWDTLRMGQVYVALSALTSAAWIRLSRGRDASGGALLGLAVAFKPSLAVWPAVLLAAGHRTAVAWAAASAGSIVALSLLLQGPGLHARWLAAAAAYAGIGYHANGSIPGLAHRVGLAGLAPWLSVAVVGAAALSARRRAARADEACALGLTAALLASPVTWPGYTLLLVPWFLRAAWDRPTTAAAALLAFPPFVTWLLVARTPATLLLAGSLHGWALLALFGSLTAARSWDDRVTAPGT